MTHVVTEQCIKCKYTDCVDVCPVDCFKEGPNFLVIHPDECIDCGVCIPECPVEAICADEDVPQDQQHFVALNAELALIFSTIARKKPELQDAERWKHVPNKLQYLDRGGLKDSVPPLTMNRNAEKEAFLNSPNAEKTHVKNDDPKAP